MFNKKGYDMKVNYDIRIMQTYILLVNEKVHNIYWSVDELKEDYHRFLRAGDTVKIIDKVIEF